MKELDETSLIIALALWDTINMSDELYLELKEVLEVDLKNSMTVLEQLL